jgi:hypothetical protein
MCASQPAFSLGLVEYAAGASASSRVLAKYATSCPQLMIQPLWSSPSERAQLGMPGLRDRGGPMDPQFGIFTKGSFRLLPMPMADGSRIAVPDQLNYIAW